MTLNILKIISKSRNSSVEKQSGVIEAVPPATAGRAVERSRRIIYLITRYEGGSQTAAWALADELEKDLTITCDVLQTEPFVYSVVSSQKIIGEWGAWA